MHPMVSIIVPVYNAEHALRQCIDSVLEQEYTDFELILVNDGSTDGSGAVCDEYARRDSRIQVIHKINTGVSDSRNMALDLARGTYLQFLDSDDWITPNATKLLVRTAETRHCDMVIADFYRVSGSRVSRKGNIPEDRILTREEYAAYMMENPADFYYGVLWNKLFRRELVEEHHLRMDRTVSWCEDFMFNLEYILYARTFCAIQTPVYYYVKTRGSLTSQGLNITKTIKMKLMVFEYYNDFYKQVLTEEDYEKKRLHVYRFLLDAANDALVPPSLFPGSWKLGEERGAACAKALNGEGFIMDAYRGRKLLDYYLQPAASKYSLTLEEARTLFCLSQLQPSGARKNLADFLNISVQKLSMLLQRLTFKGLIQTENIRSRNMAISDNKTSRQLTITFLPAADPILKELHAVREEFEQARFAGLDEDEIIQYARLNAKIKQNILNIL